MKCAFTILFVLLCLSTTAHGQSISQLFAFACSSSNCPDGTKPNSVIQASDGNLYGTTDGPAGGGIFKLTESGQITVLYTFKTNTKTGFYDQGYSPAGLAEGPDGFLYGVNSAGGPNSASSGTIFKISKTGTGFQVLETFCTSCTTGAAPNSIVAGTDGNLYGTTGYGGSFNSSSPYCPSLGCGVIFRLTPPGTYAVLHALNGTTESSLPLGVVQATDGNLYGTAGFFRPGTVFKFQLSNSQFSTLYNFPSGIFPLNRVTQASNGLLYGSTRPTNATNGSYVVTIFSTTTSGSEQDLQQLTLPAKKQFAVGPFLQATDGNLWNTSYVGGSSGLGFVFSITPSGGIVEELSLTPAVGVSPIGGVIQATDGTLFGAASADGTAPPGKTASGTVYKITGLPAKK
jgi:hypothetical protein